MTSVTTMESVLFTVLASGAAYSRRLRRQRVPVAAVHEEHAGSTYVIS